MKKVGDTLKKAGVGLLTITLLYATTPKAIHADSLYNYNESSQGEEKKYDERLLNIRETPFQKSNYNIAMIFDDDSDELKLKGDLERNLGNLEDYPYSIIKHEEMEETLKWRFINKHEFMRDPLKYKHAISDLNLDYVIVWGYSTEPWLNIAGFSFGPKSVNLTGKYVDYVNNVTETINIGKEQLKDELLISLLDKKDVTQTELKKLATKALANEIGDHTKVYEILKTLRR